MAECRQTYPTVRSRRRSSAWLLVILSAIQRNVSFSLSLALSPFSFFLCSFLPFFSSFSFKFSPTPFLRDGRWDVMTFKRRRKERERERESIEGKRIKARKASFVRGLGSRRCFNPSHEDPEDRQSCAIASHIVQRSNRPHDHHLSLPRASPEASANTPLRFVVRSQTVRTPANDVTRHMIGRANAHVTTRLASVWGVVERLKGEGGNASEIDQG